jgi:hypothetical protein
MSATRGRLRIGTSGYHYDHWQEVFYPRHLPQKRWFAYYACHFDTVEINNTLPTGWTSLLTSTMMRTAMPYRTLPTSGVT